MDFLPHGWGSSTRLQPRRNDVSDPGTTGSFAAWDVLKWLFGVGAGIIMSLLGYIGKRHEQRLSAHNERLRALEIATQSRATAEAQRIEIHDELRQHRQETTSQFTRVFERLDKIVESVHGKADR